MADQELTDLTTLPTPATTDLLYVVADPGGTPVDRKATIAAVLALVPPSGGSGPTTLDRSRPNVTVTNTATETDVYTLSIPGGTLGTTGEVYARLLGKKVKNGGGSDGGMVLRVYYGATLIARLAPDTVNADDTEGLALALEVWLLANAATGAQIAHARLTVGKNAIGGPGGVVPTSYRTAAEDSTAAKTLRVTWQQAAVPEHSFTSEYAKVTAE